jgi:hypothetical protein
METLTKRATIRVPVKEPVPGQLDLEGEPAAREATIQEAFEAFHQEHPHLYQRLVQLAEDWKEAGHHRCSIGMLWEVLRWQHGTHSALRKRGTYALNNNYRSRYARMLIDDHPELAGMFETRELQSP